MSFLNLSSFLKFLERRGALICIKAPVDPVLEITEIANRVMEAGGPALLFENVQGSRFPLVINALGTEERVRWALGDNPQALGKELSTFAEAVLPPSPRKLWAHRSTVARLLKMKPCAVKHGPVFSNRIEPADLGTLPIAQSWPKDGGKFITFPLVITKSPLDGRQNMGVYRMHVYGKNTTGLHWQISKGGGYHYQEAEKENQAFPVVVAVGADPILMMCGVLPLPEGMDELAFSGFLRRKRTPVGFLGSNKLMVPAEAEFLLEGFVPPQERHTEGPYGDHFGHYSNAAPYPVFHIERIWHRTQAVYPIAVVGKPPQEDQVLGDAVQEMLLPILKIMHPEVRDLWAYMQAGFHNLCVVSVHQRFAKEAVKTGLWILGEGQLALTKVVILVDGHVSPRNFMEVLKTLRRNFDPAEDFILLPATSQDTLDFTGPRMNLGSKMILDGTTSGRPNELKKVPLDLGAIKKVDSRIHNAVFLEETLLVIQTKSHGREVLQEILKSGKADGAILMAAVSLDVPLDNPTLLLWGIFTRFDCFRDTFFAQVKIQNGHPVYQGSLCIDATWKDGYPEPLEMLPEIVKKVDQRWKEYGISLKS